MIRSHRRFFGFFLLALCLGAPFASAQTLPPATALPANAPSVASTDPLADTQMQVGMQESFALKNKLRPPDVNPRDLASLFFTKWQYALLQEAKRGYLSGQPGPGGGDATASRGIRELSLGGIAYRSAKDWTVWLNGQRLEPTALPPQILDIKVTADHVDLKWFDRASNLIFPIRLRPHQRFNLDARMFLPGAGTGGG